MHSTFCKMKPFTEEEILEILDEIDPNVSDLEDDHEACEANNEELMGELHPDDEIIIDYVLHNSSSVLLDNVSLLNVQNFDDIVIDEDLELEGDILSEQILVLTSKAEIKWKRRKFNGSGFHFEPDFQQVLNILEPYQYFEQFFPDELFEKTTFYTNLYAVQNKVSGFKPAQSWEMKMLIGLQIAMGCMRLDRKTTFWDPTLSIELFKNTMSLKRFRQLRLNLHFIDNLMIPPDCNDKFFKIRPLIETIRKRCQEEPVEEDVCIDEQIIPFKGKLSCKIYQKGKPNPWGIKNYVLCGKSGFPYEFELYQGKNTNLDENLVRTVGFSSAIVLHLCKRLTKSGHNLYFDNFFNSYNLLEILSQRNINAAGTARVNRFGRTTFVSDKDLLKQGRGSSDCLVSTDGKICIVKWLDNKPIYLASNFVAIGEQDVAKRFCKKTKKTIEVKRPKIVKEHNESMGGVDLLDQLISYYRIFLKSSKWTLRITSHFIDFALVSS
ncbi:piggyBac transposable element-derived protein 3-like [Bactrocera dorsalis]|uniref:PiggyBac transposable element-derived protein 3-like n=1 Tax=Bactrocera dorsalis TaxID=27457 RepID=A0ABM3JF13_BACDO|nr:piggyBac transposable element-derived protein 3-like [Bactrocera dorsalis]